VPTLRCRCGLLQRKPSAAPRVMFREDQETLYATRLGAVRPCSPACRSRPSARPCNAWCLRYEYWLSRDGLSACSSCKPPAPSGRLCRVRKQSTWQMEYHRPAAWVDESGSTNFWLLREIGTLPQTSTSTHFREDGISILKCYRDSMASRFRLTTRTLMGWVLPLR